MYTEEGLLNGTFFQSVVKEELYFQLRKEERPEGRRKSSSIVAGVLSPERVNELIKDKDAGWMINDCGVVGVSDLYVVFLTDDSSIQLNLPKSFHGMQWKLPNWTGSSEPRLIETAEQFLELFYKGKRVLSSMEELLAYLNKDEA